MDRVHGIAGRLHRSARFEGAAAAVDITGSAVRRRALPLSVECAGGGLGPRPHDDLLRGKLFVQVYGSRGYLDAARRGLNHRRRSQQAANFWEDAGQEHVVAPRWRAGISHNHYAQRIALDAQRAWGWYRRRQLASDARWGKELEECEFACSWSTQGHVRQPRGGVESRRELGVCNVRRASQ